MKEFTQIRWKGDLLRELGLPDIGYPVPMDAYGEVLSSGGQVGFANMLYWLQEFSAGQKESWHDLEPAMTRLSELLAPEDSREALTTQGDTWFLEVGPVDLSSKIVTVQRRDTLIAAIAPRKDYTLRVAAYHPLDANSIKYLLGLSQLPDPEHGVCMRPNNWEYALDQACGSNSAFYACERGESYLSTWEHGLGVRGDGVHDERFIGERRMESLAPILLVTQLGVYYEVCSHELL
jgi:hypothetical protein